MKKVQVPTGIAIGAGTGFTSRAGEVAVIANNNVVSTEVYTNGGSLSNGGYDLGTHFKTEIWNNLWIQQQCPQYADLAENYLADNDYDVGTVLVFGGEQELTTTQIQR